MTTCFLAPDPIQGTQFIPGTNTPANGGQLFFYVAGSSTKQTVYKDNAAGTAWTNPIVLDSGGNLPSGGEVWFPTGQTFKVVFAPSNDSDPPSSPYWTKDTLSGMNDITATASEWVTGPTPTFVNTSSFTVAGDQTAILTQGRRVLATVTAGTVYGYISSSTFGTSTTVNVLCDSGNLDSGLNAFSYGLLQSVHQSMPARSDAYPVFENESDKSKRISVDLSGLSANVIRKYTMPDKSGILAMTSDLPFLVSTMSNSLTSDVALSTTTSFFDGPSLSQGTTGTWLVFGTVTVTDTTTASNFQAKLWDGTKVISATASVIPANNGNAAMALSGRIDSPSGNLRISVRDTNANTGKIVYNFSGTSTDSTITAERIS